MNINDARHTPCRGWIALPPLTTQVGATYMTPAFTHDG